MKSRRQFLKLLGIGAAITPVLPQVAATLAEATAYPADGQMVPYVINGGYSISTELAATLRMQLHDEMINRFAKYYAEQFDESFIKRLSDDFNEIKIDGLEASFQPHDRGIIGLVKAAGQAERIELPIRIETTHNL